MAFVGRWTAISCLVFADFVVGLKSAAFEAGGWRGKKMVARLTIDMAVSRVGGIGDKYFSLCFNVAYLLPS